MLMEKYRYGINEKISFDPSEISIVQICYSLNHTSCKWTNTFESDKTSYSRLIGDNILNKGAHEN